MPKIIRSYHNDKPVSNFEKKSLCKHKRTEVVGRFFW